MADKKTMTRAEIEGSLAKGERVSIRGVHIESKTDIPSGDTHPAIVCRDSAGKLTYAGMVDVIQHGGSVLYNGKTITSIAELPDEPDVVRHDEVRKQNLAQSYDEQIAAIQAQKNRLMQPAEKAEESPILKQQNAEAVKAAEAAKQGQENKGTEPKVTEKATESKTPEPKHPEPKPPEPKPSLASKPAPDSDEAFDKGAKGGKR